MILEKDTTNRLCIYFFYDEKGIVDDYVIDCLEEVSRHVRDILFVSNSPLSNDSKVKLKKLSKVHITERDNTGFDVWAYKTGIDLIGWDDLQTYDELIMMNFTIVGPLYPLREMFQSMATRNVDFWGMNVHYGEKYDPWGVMEDGFIPKHLQSHFIVVRASMLKSAAFQTYWDMMRPINSYQEAIGYHEAIFTKHFAEKGFLWESYVNTDDLAPLVSYPLMFMPAEVIGQRRCPFFKRKALFLPVEEYLGCTSGNVAAETLKVAEDFNYDLMLIMPHIIRSANQYSIRVTLNMSVIAPNSTHQCPAQKNIITIAYIDTLTKYVALQRSVSKLRGEVRVVVSGELDQRACVENLPKSWDIIRGDKISYLNALKDAAKKFDFVRALGLTKSGYSHSPLSESEAYRNAILSVVAQCPCALRKFEGAYVAPPPFHAEYEYTQGDWGGTYKDVKNIAKKLKIDAPIEEQKPSLTSSEGVFLLKSEVVKQDDLSRIMTLLSEDIKQPLSVFNHLIPFLVQNSGHITVIGYSDQAAAARLSLGLDSNIRTLNDPDDPRSHLTHSGKRKTLKGSFYLNYGAGFREQDRLPVDIIRRKSGGAQARLQLLKDVKSLRFDPVDGRGLVGRNVRASVNGRYRRIYAVNAVHRRGGFDIFTTSDPQYLLSGTFKKGDVVSVTFKDIEAYTDLHVLPTYVSKKQRLTRGLASLLFHRTSPPIKAISKSATGKNHKTKEELRD